MSAKPWLRDKTNDGTLADAKARQSSKIHEIGEALISAGLVSLDPQAKVFGLPRSTAWTILAVKHKGTGISAKTICRMLGSESLPPLVRAKIMEYAEEKAAGIYGGMERQHRKFAAKLKLNPASGSHLNAGSRCQAGSAINWREHARQ